LSMSRNMPELLSTPEAMIIVHLEVPPFDPAHQSPQEIEHAGLVLHRNGRILPSAQDLDRNLAQSGTPTTLRESTVAHLRSLASTVRWSTELPDGTWVFCFDPHCSGQRSCEEQYQKSNPKSRI
jgi:hypothetical protein